jgi:hypothetical protein
MDSTAKMMNFYFKFDFNSVFSLVSLWNFLPDFKKRLELVLVVFEIKKKCQREPMLKIITF